MRRKLTSVVVGMTLLITAVTYVQDVGATDPVGFKSTPIAKGRFGDIDVATQVLREFGDSTPQKDLWLSLQKTKGESDLHVQSNEWAVGGSTGWHSHPGHSLIIVTEGSLTAYEGDDPSCTGQVFSAGTASSALVDAGHVHMLRNEGAVVARTVVVQLVPAGAARRIDEPAPAACPF